MKRVVKLLGLVLLVLVSVSGVTYTKPSVEKFQNKTNCLAKLEVIGNKTKKSLSKENVSYKLLLTNLSKKPSVYLISINEDVETCLKNIKEAKSFHSKNMLPVSISSTITYNNKSFKEINILPGEKKQLKVTFKAPNKNVKNYWKCSKVSVMSKECNSVITSVSLKTYVPDPELR
ncbi:hypothetical protein LPB136_04760 [Tenacibaculum todarodis]|uniref:Uncharacterized protein n=1 Tax=Tenacibaculum todarodis TaxID=1850252 RepID=A0A1L3JHX9_9FLAO|nr:Fn3-like domain-containing protein [Tenacibaculum todarodis]APG64712.1 hypothetical protein LPB136_04760 [Tenacibaculum todarodis]